MPEISRFLGIIVAMYYQDHAPPHFHVRYGDSRASISVETLEILEGNLPSRILSLVLEWASLHRKELFEDWKLAAEKRPLKGIEPLV
ncbi:MAG: DUF4160 domain-containing protein [Deltaproteobacteria bacterium]|nr:DUF4160 domain-containing protein [Deltaproteobacteria bacterium]